MTMTFFLHDSIQPNAPIDAPIDMVPRGGSATRSKRPTGEFPLLLDKLRMPENDQFIERQRLNRLLVKSMAQFPATLISGRAGTGKTALAANFAAKQKNVGWFKLETADVDWTAFARYFACCLSEAGFRTPRRQDGDNNAIQDAVAKILATHFLPSEKMSSHASSLIVLDDVHHIFDAEWFGEFFRLLLYSLPPNAHLMMLCRSKPPAPLWRLRSKQVLNVIDEDQLAFTTEETADLFEMYGRRDLGPETARIESFGRASKLIELITERPAS